MKKLILVLTMVLLLTGCGKEERLKGKVVSVSGEGEYTKILLQTGEDETISILHHKNTFLWSWVDGIDAEKLLTGEFAEAMVTVYNPEKSRDGWLAEQIAIDSVLFQDAYTLSDGTKLNIRKESGFTVYETKDGTALLQEQHPVGPANIHMGGLPSLDDLNPEAAEKITAYYDALGLLYDLDEEIEKAYQVYLSSEEKPYQGSLLAQNINQTAANEKIICYAAFVTLPVGSGVIHESRSGTVFDRETGEAIDTADLFTCPEEEIIRKILNVSGMPDTDLRREMEKAFRLDFLIFHSGSLDVHFPVGTLLSQNTDYILGIEYEDVADILQPWAVPDSDKLS